jgi:hypothetical protein
MPSTTHRRVAALLAGAAGIAVAATAAALAAPPQAPLQGGLVLYLPDVESNGPPPTPTATATMVAGLLAGAPAGIEGWGDSIVVLQNTSTLQNQVEAEFLPNQGDSIIVRQALGARSSAAIDMSTLDGVTQAFYSGEVRSSGPLDALVRTHWRSGGYSELEAPEVARRLVLPLLAKTVLSHTTYFYVQNAGASDENNLVSFEIVDPATGDSLSSTSFRLQPGESTSWDTAVDGVFDDLGSGYLGALRVVADEPVALIAYGEEVGHTGTASYRGRPVERAATSQFLPDVRRDSSGESLIAITNPGARATRGQIAFVGAADSPAGAGRTYDFNFDLAPRGTVVVDLSGAARGLSTSVPRPFVGSALVSATEPVLAVVVENRFQSGFATSGAAYNGFGPGDLATGWLAPKLADTASAELVIGNPSAEPLEAAVTIETELGVVLAVRAVTIAAGQSARVPVSAEAAPFVRASVVTAGEVAVVVRSRRGEDSAAAWAFAVAAREPTPTPTATDTPVGSRVTPTATASGTPIDGCRCSILLPWTTRK